jgi:hypothetical protein
VHHGHTWFLIGTFTNGGVKQYIYHLLKQWSQINKVMILHIACIITMLELWLMMDPLGHPHVEGDMVHNFAHGFCILDHPNLPTTRPQKIKPSSHIKWHDQLQTLACWINFPWPTMAITCPNHLYALFLTHIFINLFSPYVHSFNQAINFKMITNSSPMVDQSLLTQFLELSSRFHALIHENFCWGTKST